MMKTTLKPSLFLVAFVWATIGPAFTQSPYTSETQIDWSGASIRTSLSLDLQKAGIRLPSGRHQAEQILDSALPFLIRPVLTAIGLDSFRTVEDSLQDFSISPEALDSYIEGGKKLESRLSYDLKTLIIKYEFSLIDLMSLYIKHSIPVEQKSAESYTPTRSYSGILIYVKGDYPVRGEHRGDKLVPCLFPRIYDDTMTPILERNFMAPDALRLWGTVGWSSDLEDPAVERRVGQDPLRLIASAIFGTRRSDVILSRSDALKILMSPENRNLVKLGKVVFIYGD